MTNKLLVGVALLALSACGAPGNKSGDTWLDGMRPDGSIVPGSQADLHYNVGDTVYFNFDRSDLDGEAKETAAKQAAWWKKNNSPALVVEGHCDERGTKEYNLALGERRAHSVAKALKAHGVEHGKLDTVSYGKERPAVQGSGDDVWAKNRRAVTVVSKGDKN